MSSNREPARPHTKEGRLYRHYDPKAFTILRSLSGAHWDYRGSYWQVSVAPEDLARLLEVCRLLDVEVDPALLNPAPVR